MITVPTREMYFIGKAEHEMRISDVYTLLCGITLDIWFMTFFRVYVCVYLGEYHYACSF